MKKILNNLKYIVVAICCVFACGVFVPQNVYADVGIDMNGFFIDDEPFNVDVRVTSDYFLDNFDFARISTIYKFSVSDNAYAVRIIPFFVDKSGSDRKDLTFALVSNSSFNFEFGFDSFLYNANGGITDHYAPSKYDFGFVSNNIRLVATPHQYLLDSNYISNLGAYYVVSDRNKISDIARGFLSNSISLDGYVDNRQHDYDYTESVSELGYLKNVSHKSCRVAMNTNESPVLYEPVDRYTFDNSTSTGKKLFDSGYDVQYMLVRTSYRGYDAYLRKEVYKSVKSDKFFLSEHKHEFNSETVSDLKAGVLWYYFVADDYASIYEGLSQYEDKYSTHAFFMRPVFKDGNSIKYGGWSCVTVDSNGKQHIENGVNPQDENNTDGSPNDRTESDNYLDDVVDSVTKDEQVGYGDDVIEAENNNSHINDVIGGIDNVIDDFDISSMSNVFTQLQEGASGFAGLFNVVFGWLPAWLRYSIIGAISIWIFMLIKKAIFG